MTVAALMSAASTALSIGGSVVQFQQQKGMAKASAVAAQNAYGSDARMIGQRQLQEQDAAAQSKFANQREYDAAKATAVTAAGESGVSGLSVDALLNDLAGQQANRQKTEDTNLSMQQRQLQMEKIGAANTRDSRILSAPKPSALGLAIEIGGQALDGANTYSKLKKPA